MEFKPTSEQQNALDMTSMGNSFKVSAYAGAGKTSTLKLIGEALKHKKGCYLAFNKAIAQEAQSKFGSNVKCLTFHSLAYHGVPDYITDKLQHNRLMPKEIAAMFMLQQSPVRLDKERHKVVMCSSWDQAIILNRAIEVFCSSRDKVITLAHLMEALPKWAWAEACKPLAFSLVPHANALWAMCIDKTTQIKISHSVYLKYWSLGEPIINAEFILADEAQDMDPIMMDLLMRQKAQVIYVGDKHQQIYDWRGAVNAMQLLKLPEIHLTKSFRFGQEVADVANLVLDRLLGETIKLQGNENKRSTVNDIDEPDAFLVRTNAGAFEMAIALVNEGRRPRVEIDTNTLSAQLKDADAMQTTKKVGKNSDFFGFDNWGEVIKYSMSNPQCDIAPVVRLIENHGISGLNRVISTLSDSDGDCVVCTAHKSKGLEFSSVLLGSDFMWDATPGKKAKELTDESESRLIYVAATRAMDNLIFGGMQEFFDTLRKAR